MKNVLVTGAAGFLGSHLCKHHLDAGDRVWGADNFCSSDENSAHLKDLRAYETFTFIEDDITVDWENWVPGSGYPGFKHLDLIYNFACPASPPIYQSMPILTMMTCTVGVANMLDLAQRYGAVLVHASTSEIYGDPEHSPQKETYKGRVNSYGPRACYDEGKRAAEALCFDYRKSYDVDARMVRIFNTYGPHMDPHDGRVVSNFICQAIRDVGFTVYGSGKQSRSFCYVDDLIRGIVAMGALDRNPGTPINLGNPHEFTIMDLADEVSKHFNWKQTHKVTFDNLPIDDPTQRCPDITLAREILKWEPRVDLQEGLTKTVAYFRSLQHV